jgi:hypothetical protein
VPWKGNKKKKSHVQDGAVILCRIAADKKIYDIIWPVLELFM